MFNAGQDEPNYQHSYSPDYTLHLLVFEHELDVQLVADVLLLVVG